MKSFFDFIGRTEATRAAQSYRFSQDTRGCLIRDENWLGAVAGLLAKVDTYNFNLTR
ncbi:hypothetical protein [Mesobacillus boroniphilus]|uniref:hypothetical protein n=1 Tax=Mesobacillus boroniphilus TaxID=308892 RepID=UPI001BCD2796|nr:hypothetical protein [Mesobacillus boroniphilus]